VSELAQPVRVVNLGLEGFHQDLLAQGVESIQVDWRPPAGGNERLAAILERMRKA
jgi:FdrA protein